MIDPALEHELLLMPSPYTPEMIASLCDDLRLGHEHADKVAKGLGLAAYTWMRNKQSPLEVASLHQMQKKLGAFAKKLKAAKLAINDLDDTTWRFMRGVDDMVNSDPDKSRIDDLVDDPYDFYSPKVWAVRLFDGMQHGPVKISDVIGALDTLAEAAYVATSFEKAKRGPQLDFPLKAWIRDIYYMCVCDLKVPFTRDVAEDGSAISPAACFCVRAYSVLSDKTPSSRVLQQMKLRIQEQNNPYLES